MQLSTSEISELIKSRLENFSTSAEARTQGTVISVTDGIVRIHGLSNVMAGEMMEFPATAAGKTCCRTWATPHLMPPPRPWKI